MHRGAAAAVPRPNRRACGERLCPSRSFLRGASSCLFAQPGSPRILLSDLRTYPPQISSQFGGFPKQLTGQIFGKFGDLPEAKLPEKFVPGAWCLHAVDLLCRLHPAQVASTLATLRDARESMRMRLHCSVCRVFSSHSRFSAVWLPALSHALAWTAVPAGSSGSAGLGFLCHAAAQAAPRGRISRAPQSRCNGTLAESSCRRACGERLRPPRPFLRGASSCLFARPGSPGNCAKIWGGSSDLRSEFSQHSLAKFSKMLGRFWPPGSHIFSLSLFLSFFLSLCCSVSSSLCFFASLSLCLSVSLPLCLFVSLSLCLSLPLSVSLPLCVFVRLCVVVSF